MKGTMAMNQSRRAVIMLLGFTCFTIPGCTLGGFFLGYAIDSGNSYQDTTWVRSAHDLEDGDRIGVISKDGSTVKGVFVGTKYLPAQAYASLYGDWFAKGGSRVFPLAMDDSITVLLESGENPLIVGTFAGFTKTSVIVRGIRPPGRAILPRPIDLEVVDSVCTTGSICFSAGTLQSMIAAKAIPTYDCLVVRRGFDSVSVAEQSAVHIEKVEARKPATGRIVGTAIGFAVDITVIALIVTEGLAHSAWGIHPY